MSVAKEIKAKMIETLDFFKKELSQLRSGRANAAILDHVMVEVYGASVRLRDVASVTTPEPRQILISPFDPQTAGSIAKGIEKANIPHVQPILDGNQVRINMPVMDENTRKEMVKQGKRKAEEAKVAIREVRRKGNEMVRKKKADGEIAEDEMKKSEKIIQDLTDEHCKLVDELFAVKEKEIMKI